jgi:putative lipoprotein
MGRRDIVKWLSGGFYTQKHIVVLRMAFFVVLCCYTSNIIGFAQTHPSDMNQISGLIVLQEGEQLSKSVRAVIQLLDVSIADAPAVQISEEVIENVNEAPIPFIIYYNPGLIKPSHRYAIAVDIYEMQEPGLFRRVLRNTQHYPVITGDGGEYLQIMVERL